MADKVETEFQDVGPTDSPQSTADENATGVEENHSLAQQDSSERAPTKTITRKRLRRGDVYDVDFPYSFDPTRRAPIRKFVVILQEGRGHEGSNVTTVALMTSRQPPPLPWYVFVPERVTGRLDSWVDCKCLYTVGREVIDGGRKLFTLPSEIMEEINLALLQGLCMD